MALLQRGQRLSVQPVKPAEWRHVLKLAGVNDG
jgi:predicted RNA-binding protein with PUA-like domain